VLTFTLIIVSIDFVHNPLFGAVRSSFFISVRNKRYPVQPGQTIAGTSSSLIPPTELNSTCTFSLIIVPIDFVFASRRGAFVVHLGTQQIGTLTPLFNPVRQLPIPHPPYFPQTEPNSTCTFTLIIVSIDFVFASRRGAFVLHLGTQQIGTLTPPHPFSSPNPYPTGRIQSIIHGSRSFIVSIGFVHTPLHSVRSRIPYSSPDTSADTPPHHRGLVPSPPMVRNRVHAHHDRMLCVSFRIVWADLFTPPHPFPTLTSPPRHSL
jgi:hypothetical protein